MYEYTLALSQVNFVKTLPNPCFSHSSLAYDSVHDKIWVGTNGDWASGRNGDPGGGLPASSTTGLYRVNPATLAEELFVDLQTFTFGGLFFNGAAYVYQMPNPSFSPFQVFAAESGFYDLIYAGGKLWGSFYVAPGGSTPVGWFTSFDPTNPTGSNFAAAWRPGAPPIQLAYDSASSPNRVWMNQDDDEFNGLWPGAVNADWTPVSALVPIYNTFDTPFPPASNGAHGAVVFAANVSKMYLLEMANQRLIRYSLGGTIETNVSIPGAAIGGMTIKMRYNSADGFIYIPCPAANQVIQFNPLTNSVIKIWTSTDGVDACHDVVFAGTRKFAIQTGPSGLRELT
jgi:hypothetical protein